MTQRVARPMKFAAFISIIISVAVLFVACQGAVGPEGPQGPAGKDGADGADGTDGTDGTDGADGIPGISALQALPVASVDPVLINDVKEDGRDVVGDPPTTLNASAYFRGGKAPITFTAARVDGRDDGTDLTDADNIHFNLKVDKDTGAITIEALETPAANTDEAPVWYEVGDSFQITAKDADGFTADSAEIWVKRNRAPLKTGDLTGSTFLSGNADTAGDADVVGNQPAMALDTNNKEVKATEDACDDLNTACVPAAEMLTLFTQVDGDDLTYIARSNYPSNVSVEVDSTGKLIITGHQPLLKDGAVVNVPIFFKAVDGNGMESEEHEAFIRVDPMPTIGALPTSVSVEKGATAVADVIASMTGFVTSKDAADADEAVEFFVVATDDTASTKTITTSYFIATIADTENNLDIRGLNVTPSPQPLVILIEESGDPPAQWVKHTIMVTVTAE